MTMLETRPSEGKVARRGRWDWGVAAAAVAALVARWGRAVAGQPREDRAGGTGDPRRPGRWCSPSWWGCGRTSRTARGSGSSTPMAVSSTRTPRPATFGPRDPGRRRRPRAPPASGRRPTPEPETTRPARGTSATRSASAWTVRTPPPSRDGCAKASGSSSTWSGCRRATRRRSLGPRFPTEAARTVTSAPSSRGRGSRGDPAACCRSGPDRGRGAHLRPRRRRRRSADPDQRGLLTIVLGRVRRPSPGPAGRRLCPGLHQGRLDHGDPRRPPAAG